LYSPLVESYESSKIKPYTIKRDGKDGAPMLVSPSSISFLKPTMLEKRSLHDRVHQAKNETRSSVDDKSPAPRDPIAAAHGDSSIVATGAGWCKFTVIPLLAITFY
jgi:hypothetical protein